MKTLERLEGRLHGADMAVAELERAWWLDRSNPEQVQRHLSRLEYARGFRAGLSSAVALVSAEAAT